MRESKNPWRDMFSNIEVTRPEMIPLLINWLKALSSPFVAFQTPTFVDSQNDKALVIPKMQVTMGGVTHLFVAACQSKKVYTLI